VALLDLKIEGDSSARAAGRKARTTGAPASGDLTGREAVSWRHSAFLAGADSHRDAIEHPLRAIGRGQQRRSPIADHIRRPNGSEKPSIGFQAAAGGTASASASSPFQGKSLSLTERRKIAEFMPVMESNAMFSIPAENSALKYSRLIV
jgi:hypothetical protein